MALITLHDLQAPWFQQAASDFQVLFPGVTFRTGRDADGMYLYTVADGAGCKHKLSSIKRRSIQIGARDPSGAFSKKVSRELRAKLQREDVNGNIQRLLERQQDNVYSKGSLILEALGQPSETSASKFVFGLNSSGPQTNRAAIASLLCGDWFLGIHAGNFFAKSFLPKFSHHLVDAASLDIPASRVCLMCWHQRRQLCLEDEGHTCFDCPEHDRVRESLFQQLSASTVANIEAAGSGRARLLVMLSSKIQKDWESFGVFAGRVRQARRRMRRNFEAKEYQLSQQGFDARRLQWRSRGLAVCRHGVFFARAHIAECPCMARDGSTDVWKDAKKMARIDHDLKAIIVCPFDLANFRRIGQLRAELQRLNYT